MIVEGFSIKSINNLSKVIVRNYTKINCMRFSMLQTIIYHYYVCTISTQQIKYSNYKENASPPIFHSQSTSRDQNF